MLAYLPLIFDSGQFFDDLTQLLWENGCGESFNVKLRDDYVNGEIFYSLKEAQIVVEKWRREYNKNRPHSTLGYRFHGHWL